MENLLNKLADHLLNLIQPHPTYIPLPIPIRTQRREVEFDFEDEE